MELWEFQFRDDQQLDLAGVAQVEYVGALVELNFGTIPPREPVRDWTHSVLCLRVLAQQLGKKRLRVIGKLPSLAEALTHVRERIGDARVVLDLANKPSKLRIVAALNGTPLTEDYKYRNWRAALSAHWQMVFLSFFDTDSQTVCERCGASLPRKTPTGRRLRRKLCDLCTWKKWRAKQTKTKMRKKWRDDKRNHLT